MFTAVKISIYESLEIYIAYISHCDLETYNCFM